jgi:hypothetical protein
LVDANPTAFEFVTSAQGFLYIQNSIRDRIDTSVIYSLLQRLKMHSTREKLAASLEWKVVIQSEAL